jgi:hypothetical protein
MANRRIFHVGYGPTERAERRATGRPTVPMPLEVKEPRNPLEVERTKAVAEKLGEILADEAVLSMQAPHGVHTIDVEVTALYPGEATEDTTPELQALGDADHVRIIDKKLGHAVVISHL